MPAAEFANLVTQLMEAMGQSMASVREVSEGMLLKSSDGFLYAFVEDPKTASLAFVQRLQFEVGNEGSRLVVLTPGRLPLALTAEVARRGGTLVESARFRELVRGLGLGPLLGDEPRAPPDRKHGRLLPSAHQLDEVMTRARTWSEWGVPALALRFYRQAAAMKPEFLPARNGIAEALLGLGLPQEASKAFDEVLSSDPGNVEARIGKATVLGKTGRTEEEIRDYRSLLAEDSSRVAVRAHLVAALLEAQAWPAARQEIEAMLEGAPDNARLRFLHSATLERTGQATAARRERERARALGLPYGAEKLLAEELGLPPPTPPPPSPEEAPPRRQAPTPTTAKFRPLPFVLPVPAVPAPPAPRSKRPRRKAKRKPSARAARPRRASRKPKKTASR